MGEFEKGSTPFKSICDQVSKKNAELSHSLSHIDEQGFARMVDVTDKEETKRRACAEGFIFTNPETVSMIVEGQMPKGDVLATARIAGIMGAKQTSTLIPMCHQINLTNVTVEFEPASLEETTGSRAGIHVRAEAATTGKTGVEMEALSAVSVACLTIYDMCKSVDRSMEISGVRLLRKEGGKSGLWERD